MVQFRELHAKYFTITKGDRLAAMLRYYSKTTYRGPKEDDQNIDVDYELREIPVIDTGCSKVEDYEYEILDYIYDDILKIKWK